MFFDKGGVQCSEKVCFSMKSMDLNFVVMSNMSRKNNKGF